MKPLATMIVTLACLLPAGAQTPGGPPGGPGATPEPHKPGLIQEEPNAPTQPPPHPEEDTDQTSPWEQAIVPTVLILGGAAYVLLSRRKRA